MSPNTALPSTSPSYSFGSYSGTAFSPQPQEANQDSTVPFLPSAESNVVAGKALQELAAPHTGDESYIDAEPPWDPGRSFDTEDASQTPPSRDRAHQPILQLDLTAEAEHGPESRKETRANRKRPRAQQACESCRLKKSRCDERVPKCTTCVDAGIQCIYTGPKPHKKGQSLEELQKSFNQLKNRFEDFLDSTSNGRFFASDEHILGIVRTALHQVLERPPEQTSTGHQNTVPNEATDVSTPVEVIKTEVDDEENDVLQGGLSIPFQHSTPAHKLVESWKSIVPFYGELSFDYVMRREWNREPIALSADTVYELNPPSFSGAQPPVAHSTGEKDEFMASTQLDQDRGTLTESFLVRSTHKQEPLSILELESRRAKGLWKSFLEHIHILHPFLDVSHIDEVIQGFDLSTTKGKQPEKKPIFSPARLPLKASPFEQGQRAGKKRKRIDDPHIEYRGESNSEGRPLPHHVRLATDTALVLLVFALGEICQAPDLLGGLYQDNAASSWCEYARGPRPVFCVGQPPIRYSTFAKAGLYLDEPMRDDDSDEETSGASGTSEGLDSDERSRGVPGLAYYIAASRILGQLTGAVYLPCVHAELLAGLYAAQLLRPKDSWKWIHNAGTSMLVMLQAYPNAMSKYSQSVWLNSIRVTYWACLQLESDLIAEFDLPPSGISRFEEKVPIPPPHKDMADKVGVHSIDIGFNMTCFAQQVHLRKVLNRAHSALYGIDDNHRSSKQGWAFFKETQLLESLEDWKTSLKDKLQHLWWEDSEPPPENMNLARMRAKYYGAEVIINRGYLKRAVEVCQQNPSSTSASFSSEHSFTTSSSTEIQQPTDLASLDEETRTRSQRCITALIRSTKALDGLPSMPRRLIVTNLFGTAQAQFGNILVLAAAVKCGAFSSLIPIDEFERLLKRTTRFIEKLAPMSDTMQTHLQVLRNIEKQLIFTS